MPTTPGPWIVSSGSVYTTSGLPIAKMDRERDNGVPSVDWDYNARLIAATPDLLKACKQAIQLLNLICPSINDSLTYLTLQDAIDKAEDR